MASSINLKNSGGSTLAITHSDSKGGKTIIGTDIVTSVATINDFPSVGIQEGDTVIVKEEGRGGTFILKTVGIGIADNGGTTFASSDPLMHWIRQYEGAVNVKWFGAKGTGLVEDDDTLAIQNAFSLGENIIYGNGNFVINDTISLSTTTTIDAYGAVISYQGLSTTPIYHIVAPAEAIVIKGGDYRGNASAFILSYGVTPDVTTISDYCRFTVEDVSATNMELFIDAQKAARFKVTRCQTYTASGINLEGKCVEILISDSVIFSSTGAVGTFGIKTVIHPDTTLTAKYPEGITVTNCTIDNFENDIHLIDIFVMQLSNSFLSTIFFDGVRNAVSTHSQDIVINGCEFDSLTTANHATGISYYAIISNNIIFSGISLLNNTANIDISNNKFVGSSGIGVSMAGNTHYINVYSNSLNSGYSHAIVNNGTSTNNRYINNNSDIYGTNGALVKGNSSDDSISSTLSGSPTSGNDFTGTIAFNARAGTNYQVMVSINKTNTGSGYLQLAGGGSVLTISAPYRSIIPSTTQENATFIFNIYCTTSGDTTVYLRNNSVTSSVVAGFGSDISLITL